MHPPLAVLLAAALAAGSDLDDPLTLAAATRLAMQGNPELVAAASGVRAAAHEARAARALPEPMLSYQAWQQPLSRPVDPGATSMHMLGIRWSVPFPGQLALAGRAAEEAASARVEDARALRLATQAQVAHAFVAWWRSSREVEVHLGQMGLAEKVVEAARTRYSAGGAVQADILRAETELHRLHADVAGLREASATARALLNAAMGRPVEEALPTAGPIESTIPDGPSRDRPELVAAQERASRAEALLELGERARRAPDLMVGFDYMLTPHMPDAYSLMIQVGVPWFSRRRSAEAARAGEEAASARHLVEATRSAASFEATEARARARSAKAQADMLAAEVVPRAEQTVASLRNAYLAGQADLTSLLEAEHALLDASLSAVRQRAALAEAIADLRRAQGVDLLEGAAP